MSRARILAVDDQRYFRELIESLLDGGDYFFLLADFEAYVLAQESASRLFLDQDAWSRKAILNVARMGKFSSDRTIRQYAEEIWGVKDLAPVPSRPVQTV